MSLGHPTGTRVLIIERGPDFNKLATVADNAVSIHCEGCGMNHIIQPAIVDGQGFDIFDSLDLIPLTDPDPPKAEETVKELDEEMTH